VQAGEKSFLIPRSTLKASGRKKANGQYLTPTQSRVVHNALIDGFNFSCDSRTGGMGRLSLGPGFAPVAPLFSG